MESFLMALGSGAGVYVVEKLGVKEITMKRGENVKEIVELLENNADPTIVIVYSFNSKEQRELAYEIFKNANMFVFGSDELRQKALENLQRIALEKFMAGEG